MDAKKSNYGLSSIRNRILGFSILVTLVPSVGMGWLYYDLTAKAMAEKARQRFVDSSAKVEREMDLWIAERKHDLQIFANSFVFTDNLQQYLNTKTGTAGNGDGDQVVSPRKKIITYLNFIRNKYSDYRWLAVFDRNGKKIVISDADPNDHTFQLPADWKSRVAVDKAFVGDISFGSQKKTPRAVIGIPLISDQTNRLFGVLAVEVRLQGLMPFLKTALGGKVIGPWSIYLVQKDGRPILSAAFPEGQDETTLSSAQKLGLFGRPFQLENFENNRHWVVGLAVPFEHLPWGLIIARSYDDVYADVISLRDRIFMAAIALTVVIGLGALVVARQIILPLEALTRGVLRVADGDLDVALHIKKDDELGIVSGIFNEMVMRLRKNQQELEHLAVTDPLTKLANRKQIMKVLGDHLEYYRRYGNEFSLLMVDIDHFKVINDTHGHLTGDAVLVQMAEIFSRLLRTLDAAGRYGGEEFLIILGQTNIRRAMLTAERIRRAVDDSTFVHGDVEIHLSISIGVAGVLSRNDTDNSLISRADDALYEAKAAGRNRVVLSGAGSRSGTTIPEEG